jgi:hypothetical protein
VCESRSDIRGLTVVTAPLWGAFSTLGAASVGFGYEPGPKTHQAASGCDALVKATKKKTASRRSLRNPISR